ncbi:unnamed protein product [Calypogeia fissa]
MAQDALLICSCSLSITSSALRGHPLPHSRASSSLAATVNCGFSPGDGLEKWKSSNRWQLPFLRRGIFPPDVVKQLGNLRGESVRHSSASASSSASPNSASSSFSLGYGYGNRRGGQGPISCRGSGADAVPSPQEDVVNQEGKALRGSSPSSSAPNSANFSSGYGDRRTGRRKHAPNSCRGSAPAAAPFTEDVVKQVGQALRGFSPSPSVLSSAYNSSLGYGYGNPRYGGRRRQGPISSRGPSPPAAVGGPEDIMKQLGKALWGRGLPPGALVDIARQLWGTGWQVMMGQLAPSRNEGEYDRPQSQFREKSVQGVEKGNFHLYAATTCPWAHRALIVHSLKGLGDAVPVSVAVPGASGLWEFSPATKSSEGNGIYPGTEDKANGKARLLDVYKGRKGGYEGRATVPMLWDQSQREVVNNESADIIEILNSDFNDLASNPGLDLAPASLKADIDRWNGIIYNNVNNGVYRCGFAQGQKAYEGALDSLFITLDMVEEHLASSRYLCGDSLTLADVRLFTTLYRFDPVYNTLFKCTKQKLVEYPNLSGYLRDIYQIPGVAVTCDLEAIMDGYYRVLFPLNPGSISPAIPRSSQPAALMRPHNREKLSKVAAQAGVVN